MEQINSVILSGIIGNVRVHDIQNSKVANFTVATNYVYKSRSGEVVIETTWSNVTAWGGGMGIDQGQLIKGMAVEVVGRLRNHRNGRGGTQRHGDPGTRGQARRGQTRCGERPVGFRPAPSEAGPPAEVSTYLLQKSPCDRAASLFVSDLHDSAQYD